MKLVVIDKAGNQSDELVKTIRIDATLPDLNITDPGTTPAQSKTFTGTASDNYALADADVVQYAIADSVDACALTNTLIFSPVVSVGNPVEYPVRLTDEAYNGKYLCFKATDKAGNVSYKASAQIGGIDRTPPSAKITSSKTSPTNQDITLTMEPSEPLASTPD